MFDDYQKYRKLIMVFLAVAMIPTLVRFGERHELVALSLSSALLYHRKVSRLTTMKSAILGLVLLGGFLAMGNLRQGEQVGVTASNEFEACFSTARELVQATRDGRVDAAPPQLFWADFVSIVPQQFLPFKKIDPSEWYLHQFVPDLIKLYQGYGFGVLSEAAVGFGYPEIIVKGLLIGSIFARIVQWYRQTATSGRR